jgi:hypothetical protein
LENNTVASIVNVLVTWVVTTVSSMSLMTPNRAVGGGTSASQLAAATAAPGRRTS